MKKILGLDLGTTSIGFAQIIEGDESRASAIEKIGVRIVPLSTEEQTNFEKGKAISVNADRTMKRSARRNLDRYQLRRRNLIQVLKEHKIISDESILTEVGKGTTHSTLAQRAKAVVAQIEKDEFARVLLSINKKRGYKSSRKSKNEEEGQIVDGMAVAKKLYEENLTPGQFVYQMLESGKKYLPDFYRSDLQAEFEKVWNCQKQFYPEIFTEAFRKSIEGKGQRATASAFWVAFKFNTAENKGSRDEKKLRAYKWRSQAIHQQLEKEEAAFVLTEINNNLHNSSGYLGAISDRSKELYFNKQTVGQYLFAQAQTNRHARMKNQVFYRQDYMDEFECIWETQAKFHPELTSDLKIEIRDIIIFYQRKLKSQKGLVNFCEFENREMVISSNGKEKQRTIGLKVAPKSSPLFQEFKIWQLLNNLEFRNKGTKVIVVPDLESKKILFEELNIKGKLSIEKAIKALGYNSKEWEANYKELDGNRTSKAFYEAYLKILEIEGYEEEVFELSNKEETDMSEISRPAAAIKDMVKSIFKVIGIDPDILEFNAELEGKAFENQAQYRLWHLLYSYEGDDSASGNEKLYELLQKKFGFKREHAQLLANIPLSADYGNLSTKAMRRIYPFIKELTYDKACLEAGYRHSASSLTREEIQSKPLKPYLDLLKKNSLRNPVVEKILNQMVNVVNTLIRTENEKRKSEGLPEDFHFDEVRIELARELKKNAKERAEMTANIASATKRHEEIIGILKSAFAVKNPTRNDVIRYKLYDELKANGYKDLYTNTYIPKELVFTKDIDIEHIIPQSKLFDDSFSNKTLVFRQTNLDKGNLTAHDFILSKYGTEKLAEYIARVEMMYKQKENAISKGKFKKLLLKENEIGDGFIERDLRDSQYIAKKAKNMLYDITRSVVSTTGEITGRLRDDWGLMNIMQELNFDKFKKLGLTEIIEKRDGTTKERIVDWSKRMDHRHHAVDALTVAFTKRSFIQYLNHLSARKDEASKFHHTINAIEHKETEVEIDDMGNKRRVFKLPLLHFREVAKKHLEHILISYKSKNKVVTKNTNKVRGSAIQQITLTPRGQLHKETVYGKYCFYQKKVEKVAAKFNETVINMVTNPTYKKLLLERLRQHGGDAKLAFTGKNALTKNPIYLSADKKERIPESVQIAWLEEDFSIRKNVNPENFKDLKAIEKVIDGATKKALQKRLQQYGGDAKKAFSDLDKNPIWLNEDKGICIKRVKISGVKNAEPLHFKRDHFGKEILEENNKPIPVDFISTGNNHHVAIYKDEAGDLQERVVSLFEAVQLVNAGLPVVDKNYNANLGWRFLFTLKQNEYFVFPNEADGFDPRQIDLLDEKNNAIISKNLFRVQKIASKNYMFRQHLETNVDDKKELTNVAYILCQSTNRLHGIIKVRINHIGQIVKVGEY